MRLAGLACAVILVAACTETIVNLDDLTPLPDLGSRQPNDVAVSDVGMELPTPTDVEPVDAGEEAGPVTDAVIAPAETAEPDLAVEPDEVSCVPSVRKVIAGIGDEEVAGNTGGVHRTTIAVDSLNQPHILADKGNPLVYIYHKVGGGWSESLFASAGEYDTERIYLPHIEIDSKDRAWISAWVTYKSHPDPVATCGQGVWLLGNVATAPSQLWYNKIYLTWSNGMLSLDPNFPNQCVVMARDGDWEKLNAQAQSIDSGKMFCGQSGEKLRFLISPNPGGPGVWHANTSGWNEYHSAYQNSVRHAAGEQPVTWAGYWAYPEQGDDMRHQSIGIDLVNPQAAYMAVAYNPGVVINIWDGEKMVFPKASLPVVADAPAQHGNGSDRFGPQWTPASGGGAFLCWSTGAGKVKLKYIDIAGNMDAAVKVTDGSNCAMATDPEGDVHIAYVNGGMRYRKLLTEWACP